jgi:hypothetical protein
LLSEDGDVLWLSANSQLFTYSPSRTFQC